MRPNPFCLAVLCAALCSCVVACGGSTPFDDVTDDSAGDIATLDAEGDSGGDTVADIGQVDLPADSDQDGQMPDSTDGVEPGDTPKDPGGADTYDIIEVYRDTVENQMETNFEGIDPECRPADLGCRNDEDCGEGQQCVATGCAVAASSESYQFSPDMFHVDRMVLPTGDAPTGFDMNGDGVPDNKLAWAIGIIPGGTLRFNSILSDFVRDGVFNLMIELRNRPDDDCGPLELALHPATSDINLDGLPDGDDYQVRQDGFRTDGLGPVAQINTVAIDGDLLRSGPGVELPLKVPLTDGTVLTLPLEGFRVEMRVPLATPVSDRDTRSLALGLARDSGDTNAVIGGYIRLARVVDEVNSQGKNCACAGVDPEKPIASFRVEGGAATASCDQTIDVGPCDWSADGRFCAAMDAVCLAISIMVLEMDVTSGKTTNDDGKAIPDALSLALYMSVSPSNLFEPPLAPDFAAVGDGWRVSPDCDVLQDDGPTLIGVMANDHFLPSNVPEIVSVDVSESNGMVQIATGGTQVIYTPNTGYWGYDDFTYTIEDDNGNQSTANVAIRVSPATGYDPNLDLSGFCTMYCHQYELCYPDEFPGLYSSGQDQCLSDCFMQHSEMFNGTSTCSLAFKLQELCRAALPCYRLPEFDIAMATLAAGGETEDYHCEDQVWARLEACGNCIPGTWGESCLPCPVTFSGPPCDGMGICSDGKAGDGTCACNQGYEVDPETGSCRWDDPCVPDPCTVENAIPQSCYQAWDAQQNPTYACSCENNTFWDIDTHTCFDWCNPNPCTNVPHSTGDCYAMSLDYTCGCIEAYYYDSAAKACLPM